MEEEESPSWLIKQGFGEEPEKRKGGVSRISEIQKSIKGLTNPEDIMI